MCVWSLVDTGGEHAGVRFGENCQQHAASLERSEWNMMLIKTMALLYMVLACDLQQQKRFDSFFWQMLQKMQCDSDSNRTTDFFVIAERPPVSKLWYLLGGFFRQFITISLQCPNSLTHSHCKILKSAKHWGVLDSFSSCNEYGCSKVTCLYCCLRVSATLWMFSPETFTQNFMWKTY